jgi:signal transduction histidine kinase
MKKVAFLFLTAVLAPSLVLAWLAVRSLKDQQLVVENQRLLLYQGVCGSLVKDVVERFGAMRRDFSRVVESLLAEQDAKRAAYVFDEKLLQVWPLAEVGFAVSLDGTIYSPSLLGRAEGRRFRLENDKFLSSRESVEFYWNSPKGTINLSKMDETEKASGKKETGEFAKSGAKITTTEAEFRKLVADDSEGTLARYLQNQLKLLLWYRAPSEPNMVFGTQLNLQRLMEELKPLLQLDGALQEEICLALLDDSGRPVAKTKENFSADWSRPFASTEIGEILPHWEVAVYLLNPKSIKASAQTLSFTLGLIIALLVAAIGIGGWLLVADLSRELKLARQKTDFVSNVSHELKTPLTSIRMFSELLAEGRVDDPEKQRHYLKIITAETARLTRLINNVLDFSRMERGEKKYQCQRCDLVQMARTIVESYRPQLESSGFKVEFQTALTEAYVECDSDALSQVLLNLVSNAEKYSGEQKEILVEVKRNLENYFEVKVSDRGVGVPRGAEEKIFEKFYRAHDALSSGIQGSGLGLTLARQIARAHGGDVIYQARRGTGSTFTLSVPVISESKELPS